MERHFHDQATTGCDLCQAGQTPLLPSSITHWDGTESKGKLSPYPKLSFYSLLAKVYTHPPQFVYSFFNHL